MVLLTYEIRTEIPLTDRKGFGSTKTTHYSNDGRYWKRIERYKVWFNTEQDQFEWEWLTDDWFLCDASVLTETEYFKLAYVPVGAVHPPTDKTKWAEWLDDVRKRGVIEEWDSIESHDYAFQQEMEGEMQFLIDNGQ